MKMHVFVNSAFLFLLLLTEGQSFSMVGYGPTYYMMRFQEDPQEKQLIYNGRIWRNLYHRVKGNAFFLSGEFLHGKVVFNGREFHDLRIKYDIFNDEVILLVNPQTIIIMNKEMMDEFTLDYQNALYHVINMGSDSASLLQGYVNILYDGPTALFVKYTKKIENLAVENKYDLFYQQHRIYIRKDGTVYQVSGKRSLYNLLEDRKSEIRNFVRKNRYNISRSDPYTFINVLQLYDRLTGRTEEK